MIENIGSPLPVTVNNNLGVRIRSEGIPQLLELCPQFLEIVDLTIENYPDCFFGVGHWLMPAGQIDDGKSAKPEPDRTRNKVSFVVRPPVRDGIRHSPNHFRLDRFVACKI